MLKVSPSRASPQLTAFILKGLGQTVGARLARDSGGSACMDVECATAIASRLPQLTAFFLKELGQTVGARLARDSGGRSEEHTSELQSLMRISYAVFCLKKKNNQLHISRNT